MQIGPTGCFVGGILSLGYSYLIKLFLSYSPSSTTWRVPTFTALYSHGQFARQMAGPSCFDCAPMGNLLLHHEMFADVSWGECICVQSVLPH